MAIGHEAMQGTAAYTNTDYNVAIGQQSLYSISGGDYNVGVGHQTMYNQQTGTYNYAGGHQAMYYSRTSNDYNVAIGADAMQGTANYSDADYNVAIGQEALYGITTGDNNIAIGQEALFSNTTGSENIAIGYWALHHDANGSRNTGVGMYSLYQNQGNYNTGFGYGAGAGSGGPTYTYCTFLGYDADATGSYTNAMALGHSASVTASNRIRIGDGSITRIGGNVGWSNLSDGRIKNNVQEDVVGLDFIMNLRPITYNLDKDKQDQIIGRIDSSEYAEKYDIEKIKFTGFIAQEVEEAAIKVNYDFSGVKKPSHSKDLYGLTYSEFVVPLVKATQEQQAIIEAQNITIKDQENLNQEQQQIIQQQQQQINEILKRLEEIENQ